MGSTIAGEDGNGGGGGSGGGFSASDGFSGFYGGGGGSVGSAINYNKAPVHTPKPSGKRFGPNPGDYYGEDPIDPPGKKKGTIQKLDVEKYSKPQEFGMGAFEFVEGGGIVNGGEKLFEVYQLVNKETHVVEYIGKSSQGMMKRFNQHLLDPAKQAWIHNVEPVLFKGNLTRFEAKYYEQTQIMRHGLGKLHNRINAVAEKYWIKYGIKK